ncbi:DUF1456 family protein [Pinirhizobacter soli]|uniref:DUF1456 family protein n=1 Tax=Pinirhizobacter soli TaxID=2786953 RepID=UPI00202A25EF|nr:DUF1456 family protein [Pinirhizobacter soli]
MLNNDILRSVRYMLDLADSHLVQIAALGGLDLTAEQIHGMLEKDDAPGFVPCNDRIMAHVLDGLIVFRRGRDESQPPRPVEKRITNNLVLKKLRVAFELKDQDIIDILASVDFAVSKAELNALFRQPGHNNYRPCGDQLLRLFLKGLTSRLRG